MRFRRKDPAARRRLFVHVGYPKTGTTTIQHACDAERDHLLATHGLLYPNATIARPEFGHHNLAWEALGRPYDRANGDLAALVTEVDRVEPSSVLISSEAFTELLADRPGALEPILGALERFTPTLIVTVRRLDHYVESVFEQQFNAWVWGRPIRRSTDVGRYVELLDVETALAPVRTLRESGHDVVFLPYRRDILPEIGRIVGLDADTVSRLASHGDLNRTWLGPRGRSLVDRLVRRPDEEAIRRHVAENRQAFQEILESLGGRDATRLLPVEVARRLVAQAEPVYREIGSDFAREVIGDGIGEDWESVSGRVEFDATEVDRINAFFGWPVISG